MAGIHFNDSVRLIISDVDETIADLYLKADEGMLAELQSLLDEGKVLFLISGQSLKNIIWRIIDYIKPGSRKRILIGHCSGSEVWGFDDAGRLKDKPFYSVYENSMDDSQKTSWRRIIQQLISEFHLKVHDTMPIKEFKTMTREDPLSIMLEDRGPQITLEVVNGYQIPPSKLDLLDIDVPLADGHHDLRIPIMKRALSLLEEENLPITPRLAGEFAIDFAIKGVSKTTAVKNIISDGKVLSELGLSTNIFETPDWIEVWGDKFSVTKGGTDRHISEALPKDVRSITFRQENPRDFLDGYNIVVWDGIHHLHEGLLEFLKSRK